MTTYGYTRVSSADQADGSSLAEQARRVEGVAAVRGEQLSRIFEDAAVSGSIPLERRPAGAELVAVLKPGDTVIVSKLDRAFRHAADALTRAETWKSQGVRLIVADMGPDAVTDNGVSKMFFGMLALVAEFERGRILERTAEGRSAKARAGGHVGGSAPFGYRVEGTGRQAHLVEVPEQQAAIATIRLLCGALSHRRIAAEVAVRHPGVQLSYAAVRRICREVQP